MALMEWRCNHQAFGRDVQPAITNSPTHLLTTTIRQTTTATNCAMLYALRNSKAKAMAHRTHTHTHKQTFKHTHAPFKTKARTQGKHHGSTIVCPRFHSLRVKDRFPCLLNMAMNNFFIHIVLYLLITY